MEEDVECMEHKFYAFHMNFGFNKLHERNNLIFGIVSIPFIFIIISAQHSVYVELLEIAHLYMTRAHIIQHRTYDEQIILIRKVMHF